MSAYRNYIQTIKSKYQDIKNTEYGYRTPFEKLLEDIFGDSFDIGHDQAAQEGNKPDFVVKKDDVPRLYIEVKDIGANLDKTEKTAQIARYLAGYTNFVLSDYLEFRFYRNGQQYQKPISLGKPDPQGRVIVDEDNYDSLKRTLLDFMQASREPIKSGHHLARIMAGKAARIRDSVGEILESQTDDNLLKVYEVFKNSLIKDLNYSNFADMYSQTMVYGLFVARFHDHTPDDFSRTEAQELVPKSNPFLRHFFNYIAGPDFNKELAHIVNELCEVFQHSDIAKLLEDYYRKSPHIAGLKPSSKSARDPVVYFYEDFLKEYDLELKKDRGAFYTPAPVVDFIVRQVDNSLKADFGLFDGLADISKTDSGEHKVQVLDPAAGTGTFISATIGQIYRRILQKKQKGMWPQYVYHDLLPRVHGFELMMTPYVIAHLKLGLAFKETGFKHFNNERLRIYLTNSLEDIGFVDNLPDWGLGHSISTESIEASKIKNKKPIMIVVGNPPYNNNSFNKGEWIRKLIEPYKKDLNERKINLDDDYIKFIRFGQYFVDKNDSGILAYITNNSFLSGPTHRQMRKNLLNSFDKIYILNLHGAQDETAPDGTKDENVFDITIGVSINIFVKKKPSDFLASNLGEVYYADLYGKRGDKFAFLDKHNFKTIDWQELNYKEPYYFFTPKDFSELSNYEKGFRVTELFANYLSGVGTKVDHIATDHDADALETRVRDILNNSLNFDQIRQKYGLSDRTTWEYNPESGLRFDKHKIIDYEYRPFDSRKIYYDPNFISRARYPTMRHFVNKQNLGLETTRIGYAAFIGRHVSCEDRLGVGKSYRLPLWIYYGQDSDLKRKANFSSKIVGKIAESVGLEFSEQGSLEGATFSPLDVLDYVYACLYSNKYKEAYSDLLEIDFPRIPYPKSQKVFTQLVALGADLRKLHLLESDKVKQASLPFPVDGDCRVERVKYDNGRVYINQEQYFNNVPLSAWESRIGNYQPAQAWLKARKGRILTSQDIHHYQFIITALNETAQTTKAIDDLNFF